VPNCRQYVAQRAKVGFERLVELVVGQPSLVTPTQQEQRVEPMAQLPSIEQLEQVGVIGFARYAWGRGHRSRGKREKSALAAINE
jgi:hypothetical protein